MTSVGDPGHPADLANAIYRAHDQGATEIAINPGTYHLPPMNGRDSISFDQWRDTIIHAAGATLIFEELDGRPVHFCHCENVTWDGGTLRFVHPSFTQGRILATGSDANGDFCDWNIDAGYPADIAPGEATYDVVDQKTRVLKVNTGDWGPETAGQIGPRLFRLHYAPDRGGGFAVNDWLVARAPGGSTILHLDGCKACAIRNVTLQNAGFAAFFETGGEGGNHYLHCKLQPGPRPPGATEPELVGCGADGFHSVDTVTGPDIEDCEFTGVFLDDCIAIHGTFDRVIAAEGDEVTLSSAHPLPNVGDPLRIANTEGFFAQANCAEVERTSGEAVSVKLDRVLPIPIDHSQNDDSRKGTKLNDVNNCGRGYKILRCKLGDTRSRGILAKADDGLIDGCLIRGCGMSGISIGPEFWWNEAGYCWNVTVSNNKIVECNKNNGDQAAVWLHGDGAIGNRNILIKGNTFDLCYGDSMIRSDWTDGVQMTANRIIRPFEIKSGNPGCVIRLAESRNVRIEGNAVSNQGRFGGNNVGMGPGMNPSDVKNFDPLASTSIQPGAGDSTVPGSTPEILTPAPPLKPHINGPHIYGERPNHPFLYRIPATGRRPITFLAQDLPAGLSLDSATGFITGTTNLTGTFPVTLQASNALGKDQSLLKLVIGDKIALTPPLGFNTWNHFNGGINDKIIRDTADAMIQSGLADHGWSYINLDDCWMRRPIGAHRNPGDIEPAQDPSTGAILPNLWRFPDIKGLADYVHAHGLKFGIYSSPGFRTCAWSAGSQGHEDQDAREFADWGVDYLKYDWCSYGYTANYLRAQDSMRYLDADDAKELDQDSKALYALIQAQHEETAGESGARIRYLSDQISALLKKVPRDVTQALIIKYQKEPYAAMGRSLAKVNRDIIYSFCQYGDGHSWEWAGSLGANSWRTTGDIQDKWASICRLGFVQQAGLEKFAGPGHWNDPDMLEVGNGGLSPDEETTHMTLWCMLSAPLLIGCDLTKMSDFTKSLFTNDEVLAIDQDELGEQGHVAVTDGDHRIWIKKLSDGALAVALFNLGAKPDKVAVRWNQLGLNGSQQARDLWRQKNLGIFAEEFSANVASHGVILLRVSPSRRFRRIPGNGAQFPPRRIHA